MSPFVALGFWAVAVTLMLLELRRQLRKERAAQGDALENQRNGDGEDSE